MRDRRSWSAPSVWPPRPTRRPPMSPWTERITCPGLSPRRTSTPASTPISRRISCRACLPFCPAASTSSGSTDVSGARPPRASGTPGESNSRPSSGSKRRSDARTRAFRAPRPRTPFRPSVRISIAACSRSTPKIFSALAIASSRVSPSASTWSMTRTPQAAWLFPAAWLFLRAVDQVLLRDAQQIVDQPVNGQAGRKVDEHEGKNQRHHEHHAPLVGIARARGHPLLGQHAAAHQQSQDRNPRVASRQADRERLPVGPEEVLDQQELRMAQLDGSEQRAVEPDENRKLEQHRQAAPEGVHLVAPVELHDLLVQAFLVVLGLFLDPLHLRLEFLHLLHRHEALVRERREKQLDQNGEQDDVEAVARGEVMKKVQHVEQRDRDEIKVAEVDRALHPAAHAFQDVELLGADEKIVDRLAGPARGRLDLHRHARPDAG